MPAHAPAPRGAHRHARRAQGGAAAAATSTPRPRPRLLRLGLIGVLVLCLQGFSPSAWVAPAAAQVVSGGTLLIDEKFDSASVSNPDFTVHGSTCLTGARGAPPSGQAQIPDCTAFSTGPVPPLGALSGYLQLTDAHNERAGDILYNRPIPATAGLIATFEQWQYGGTGADGISFFLVDGGTQLTATGGKGGSLGYAQHNTELGILGGALGLGLDAFGNYYNDKEMRGTGCSSTSKPPFPMAFVPGVVTLRGPGDLDDGYCYQGSTTKPGTNPPQSSLPGTLRAGTLELAARRVQIIIQPATGTVAPRVLVAIDFKDGKGLQPVLNVPAPPNLPPTYKFGWAGSTGAQNDVHLLRNAVVTTVEPLNKLHLVKQLDRTNPLPNPPTEGSVVPYQFVVTNAGSETLTALQVQDPHISPISCPATILPPAPTPGSTVVCTGSYTITPVDVVAGVFANTATATGRDPGDQTVTSNPSSVDIAVGTTPLPRLALKKFVVDRPPYSIGQQVTFLYQLTNEGNVTLTNLRVTDDKVAKVDCTQPPRLLRSPLRSSPAFGAATVCEGTHVLQAGDLVGGVFTNTAFGLGDASGRTVESNRATVSLPVATDIAVTKTVDQAAPVLGNVVVYTVTATNQGAIDATGVQLTDVLPPSAFVAAIAAEGTTYNATTGVWTIGNLARGASATLLLRGRVTVINAQTNVARLTALDQEDSNPANDQAEAMVEGRPLVADLAVAKTVTNATPQLGETIAFTVTATNLGPDAASGVHLTDGVPPGLTFLSATPSQGTYTPTDGAWDIGELAVGARATLTLVMQVARTGLIQNVAIKTAGDQRDPNTSNNSSEVDLNSSEVGLTPQPVADIQVHKTADLSILPLGSDVTFTVTVTNAGPNAASGVALTDVLPAGLALVSWTPLQGTYTPTTGVWAIGTLAVGTQTTLTLQATVQAVGPLTNRAAKTAQTEPDPNPFNDASGVTVNGQAADVQVVKTVDRPLPQVGELVTFTITVTNNGPNAVSGVEVLDRLSSHLAFVSATPSQGTYTAATGVWVVGTLAQTGAAATATLQMTALVTQAGPLTNLAVKIDQDQPDPNPSNDQDSVAPPGQPVADLVVTKSNSVDSVAPGTEVTYTVVVANRGPSPVIGATVSDPIPLILTDPSQQLRSFEGLTWTCVASAGSACPVGGTGDVLASVDLLAGGTATFTVRGRVAPAARGTLVNTATVTPPAEVLDPLPGDNSATDTDRLTPLADLSITKTDAVPSVVPGAVLRYALVVHNAGPSAVFGARVQDPASAALQGVRWTCVASAGSSCPAEGTGPIDILVNLASEGTVIVTLTGTVTEDATGTLANTATVTPSALVTDPEPGNNTATDTNAVLPPPLNAPPSGRKTVQMGALADLEWRVVWRNNGNAVPLRIRVLDPIPAATTYVDDSLTCVAHGQSTVDRCDFDVATNQLVYDGTLGPDPGATTDEQAAHDVVITFRTTVLPGITQVANQALAHWDANGTDHVDDDITAGQVPVQTGTAFGQSDPTVALLPPLACLFQQRLLALDLTGPAPAAGGPADTVPTDGQDAGVDSGADRQTLPGADGVFALTTPLDDTAVAGTTLTLAVVPVAGTGTIVAPPTEIRLANGAPVATLDAVENTGRKAERVPARAAHVVVTADGVVADLPATALATADTLRIERVATTDAPAPLPGVAASPLVRVTLGSGQTTFASPITLSLPYADADHDGLVDTTSPPLPALTLRAWIFDAARQRWVRLPEARVFTAFNVLQVATTQTGLYGVFQETDIRLGLVGTSASAAPFPLSASVQGSGWQDIGVVTTFPFLVPFNTTTLPDGTYEVRAVCSTQLADLVAVQAEPTPTDVGRSVSTAGGGGCSLQPGDGWSRAAVLATVGNLGLPLLVLLILHLWSWRRQR